VSRLEYTVYALPKAAITLYLRVPVSTSQKHVAHKEARSYTELKADVHEENEDLLRGCLEVYDRLAAEQVLSHWVTINCQDRSGGVRSREDIADDIWQAVCSVRSLVPA